MHLEGGKEGRLSRQGMLVGMIDFSEVYCWNR